MLGFGMRKVPAQQRHIIQLALVRMRKLEVRPRNIGTRHGVSMKLMKRCLFDTNKNMRGFESVVRLGASLVTRYSSDNIRLTSYGLTHLQELLRLEYSSFAWLYEDFNAFFANKTFDSLWCQRTPSLPYPRRVFAPYAEYDAPASMAARPPSACAISTSAMSRQPIFAFMVQPSYWKPWPKAEVCPREHGRYLKDRYGRLLGRLLGGEGKVMRGSGTKHDQTKA